MKEHKHDDMISEEIVATGETDTSKKEGRCPHRRTDGTGHHHHHHHGEAAHADGEGGHHKSGHCCGKHHAPQTSGRCPHRRPDSDGTRLTHDDPRPRNEEDEAAENLIRWGAARAGVLAMTPLVSGIALMANEVYMIGRLAKVYGVKLSDRAIMGFLGAFGARVVGKMALAMIPLPGLSVPVAISVTYGLGRVAQSWVKDGMPVDMQPYVESFADLKAEGEAKVEELADNVHKHQPLGDETKEFGEQAQAEMKEKATRGVNKAARAADKALTDVLLMLGVSQSTIDDKKALAKGVLAVTKETTEELATELKERVAEVAQEAKVRAAKAKEQAEETAEEVKDRLDRKVDEWKEDGADWKETAKEKAEDLKGQAKEKAADLKEQAKGLKEQAQEHQARFKDRVQEKAEAFKRDAQTAGDAVEEAAQDVANDVADAVDEAKDTAKKLAKEAADKLHS